MAVAEPLDIGPGLCPPYGTLYVAAPNEELRTRILGVLEHLGVVSSEPGAGVLAVDLDELTLEHLGVELVHCLGTSTLNDCPALMLACGVTPTLSDLGRMQPLAAVLATAQHRWLTEVVTQGRLTSYFQPIVHMSDPTSVFAYECLLRGHRPDGKLIPPEEIFYGARLAGWLPELDRIARCTAFRCAVAHGVSTPIFVNMVPTTVNSAAHHLATITQELQAAGLPRERIVLEIVETEQVELIRLQQIVAEHRKAGFRIALDDVGSGYNSLNLIARLKPDLIKLDIDLIRDVHRDSFKREIAAKLLEAAHNLGVCTVAEGIESEDEWRWFLDHGAEYGQGYAFARPAPAPPVPQIPQGSFIHGMP